jgi:two-component system copper resistance phosphate regulon response regulator CusR
MRLLVLLWNVADIVELQAVFSAAGFWVRSAKSLEEITQIASSDNFEGVFIEMTPSKYPHLLTSLQRIRACDSRILLFVRAKRLTPRQRQELVSIGVDAVFGSESFDEATLKLRYLLSVGRSLLNETPSAQPHVLRTDSVEIDLIERTVKRDDQVILLREKEFSILELMVRHRDQVLTPAVISNYLWGSAELASAVEVYMTALQKKLDGSFSEKVIRKTPGQGYTFVSSKGRSGTIQGIR